MAEVDVSERQLLAGGGVPLPSFGYDVTNPFLVPLVVIVLDVLAEDGAEMGLAEGG
jgi:hypothetical protein